MTFNAIREIKFSRKFPNLQYMYHIDLSDTTDLKLLQRLNR